jgi:Family of unknown function (DUF5946)
MLSAPGCWALYASLLVWANELTDRGELTAVQRIADTYAVQHATSPDRRNRQSVAVHLMSLCGSIEQGIPGARLRTMIGAWAHIGYPELTPRPAGYPVTICSVTDSDVGSRMTALDTWAVSAWTAWSAHHDTVRGWLARAMKSGA